MLAVIEQKTSLNKNYCLLEQVVNPLNVVFCSIGAQTPLSQEPGHTPINQTSPMCLIMCAMIKGVLCYSGALGKTGKMPIRGSFALLSPILYQANR